MCMLIASGTSICPRGLVLQGAPHRDKFTAQGLSALHTLLRAASVLFEKRTQRRTAHGSSPHRAVRACFLRLGRASLPVADAQRVTGPYEPALGRRMMGHDHCTGFASQSNSRHRCLTSAGHTRAPVTRGRRYTVRSVWLDVCTCILWCVSVRDRAGAVSRLV